MQIEVQFSSELRQGEECGREIPGLLSAMQLWAKLGDVPVDNDGRIDTPFLHFEAGTNREDIWHWFEDEFDLSLADLEPAWG